MAIKTMNTYINNTSYSTSELIKLIFKEEKNLSQAIENRDYLIAKANFYHKEFTYKDLHEDFDEIHVMRDFNTMAQAKQSADKNQNDINILKMSIEAKEFSLRALSGALLQIAKQGISVTHSNLDNCPSGRAIGTECLKNIIWQARNQSMHFEEGNPRPPVKLCFKNLEHDFGSMFSLNNGSPENLARHVVNLLGWRDYSTYKQDMNSMI
jgi:hypothetical protein